VHLLEVKRKGEVAMRNYLFLHLVFYNTLSLWSQVCWLLQQGDFKPLSIVKFSAQTSEK
jgi:hypothetical protein